MKAGIKSPKQGGVDPAHGVALKWIKIKEPRVLKVIPAVYPLLVNIYDFSFFSA